MRGKKPTIQDKATTAKRVTAIELIRRINRARAAGEDVSILERELAAVEAAPSMPKPPRKTRAEHRAEQSPLTVAGLKMLIAIAQKKGFSLGWVMFEFKKRNGRFPGRHVWKAVVGQDTRDAIIDAQVDRVAMQARSTGF